MVREDVHEAVREDVKVIVPTDVQADDSEEVDDMEGATPMHLAAKNGQADVVKSLMLQGANPSAKNANGANPLHLAAKYGHANVIIAMLGFGRDENQPTVTEPEEVAEPEAIAEPEPETPETSESAMSASNPTTTERKLPLWKRMADRFVQASLVTQGACLIWLLIVALIWYTIVNEP